LDVPIDPGVQHGQKIVFSGEADQAPGIQPGDVVLVIQQKEHDVFKRNGSDLIMEKKISLLEALTGFEFVIKHLDGRLLLVKHGVGGGTTPVKPEGTEVIKPGSVKAIRDEGMPTYKRPFEKGYLFIKFVVEFPATVDAKLTKELRALLPAPTPATYNAQDVEETTLFDMDMERRSDQQRRGGEAYEEDEDRGGGGGGGVQCASQ